MDGAAAAAPPRRLRLLSFNVNSVRAVLKRLGGVSMRAFLESLRADIICLQETKVLRPELRSLRELADVSGW